MIEIDLDFVKRRYKGEFRDANIEEFLRFIRALSKVERMVNTGQVVGCRVKIVGNEIELESEKGEEQINMKNVRDLISEVKRKAMQGGG